MIEGGENSRYPRDFTSHAMENLKCNCLYGYPVLHGTLISIGLPLRRAERKLSCGQFAVC
jgi:hypothetical protein